jgi:mono/diheme cytochrome c family protein
VSPEPKAAEPPPPTAAPAAPSPASEAQIAELSKASGGPSGGLYTVKEGTKVDANTLAGWKTWRALACDRCHGAEQQGLVGPALVVSLHRLSKEEFRKTITDGRPEKGMPPFNGSPMVMQNWENLYAYLKGRADAQIQPGHLYPIE